jgi:hypothetical protein
LVTHSFTCPTDASSQMPGQSEEKNNTTNKSDLKLGMTALLIDSFHLLLSIGAYQA